MPRRKFSMIKSRYRQTTPNVAFKQGRIGPYPNPRPLIGWRKQLDCDRRTSFDAPALEDAQWGLIASMTTPRYGLGVAAIGTRLFAVGGNGPVASVEWIDTANPSAGWVTTASMTMARYLLGVAAVGTRLFAVGGSDLNPTLPAGTVASVEWIDTAVPMATWSTTASMTTARNGVGVAAIGTRLYAVGGVDSADFFLSSVEWIDTANLGDGWTLMTAHMATARANTGVAAIGTRLYAVGGLTAYPPTALSSVEWIDTANPSDVWHTMGALAPARFTLGAAAIGTRLFAVGGWLAPWPSPFTPLASVEWIDTANPSAVWTPLASMTTARSYLGVAAVGCNIYAVGGLDSAVDAVASAETLEVCKTVGSGCLEWTEVFKNNCCQPVIKRIQNKNGNVDGTYSYTRGGYLQKRYRSYDQNAFNFSENDTLNNHPTSTYYILGELKDCSGINHWLMPHSTNPIHAAIATYKKSNPAFKKQGAVSNRARLNRLKYNTIVGSMPDGKIYFGGQPPHPTIVKSKNRCFCSRGLGSCHGQNIKCCTTFCKESFTGSWSPEVPSAAPGDVVFTVGSEVPFGILISFTSTTLVVRLYDCNGSYESIPDSEGILLGEGRFTPVGNVGVITEGCGPPL